MSPTQVETIHDKNKNTHDVNDYFDLLNVFLHLWGVTSPITGLDLPQP